MPWLRKTLNPKTQAYYLHPFKPNDTEQIELLKPIWDYYYEYMAHAFDHRDLKDIKPIVLPENMSEDIYKNCITSKKKDSPIINPGKVFIDVIFKNMANYIRKDDTIALSSKIYFVDDSGKEERKLTIWHRGSVDDLQYLAMRTSLEFLFFLKRFDKLKLSQSDEERIKKRILTRYADYIENKPEIYAEVAAELQSAMTSGSVTDGQMVQLLEAYITSFDYRASETGLKASRYAMRTKTMVAQ